MFQLSKTLVRFMRKGRVPSKHGNKDYYKGIDKLLMEFLLRALKELEAAQLVSIPSMVPIVSF